ncbi:hypothetical protein F4776DRAFT_673829 [Hypoxylon sp. NC0597]|nr:hypothetical protein F4776DRAFT_673829 [Hypoxylon sp. NC0597]
MAIHRTMAYSGDSHTLGPAKAGLYILGLVGTLGTWGRTVADGTLVHLYTALHGGSSYILPGTEYALKTSFTGIYWPIDYLLDVLVIFFWESVDGSHPDSSAIGIYFLGQLFAILVPFYVNHLRGGNGPSIVTPTLWALSFQMGAIGFTGWIWALWFISSSPLLSSTASPDVRRRSASVNPRLVRAVLPALLVGYAAPAIVMGIPSPRIVSNSFQQWAVVTWNIFPLTVMVLFKVFAGTGSPSDQRHVHDAGLHSVRTSYAITLAISFAMHVAIVSLSVITVLFPAIFDPSYRQHFSPASLFIPPLSIEPTKTVGDGIRSFFLWDQLGGYSVVLLVQLVQLRNAAYITGKHFNWLNAIVSTALASLIVGPGSTAVLINWWHDELLLGANEDSKAKNKAK